MMKVHGNSEKFKVLDPMISSDNESDEEKSLEKWKEYSWSKHNLEERDVLPDKDDKWLNIWLERKRVERQRVIQPTSVHYTNQSGSNAIKLCLV